MKSIADQLPPEIARRIHPARRANEAAYWAARGQLLERYKGLWIGFADGKVIACGASPVAVFHAAEATALHPFFVCVGKEDEGCRIRRARFPYDANYAGEPLPTMTVEFRNVQGSPGPIWDRVIPDTGADASVLPWIDCQRLQLDPSMGAQALLTGVAGSSAATLAFQTWVLLDGQEYACRLQADFVGDERILGRDVLNRLEILFRGPLSEIIINP